MNKKFALIRENGRHVHYFTFCPMIDSDYRLVPIHSLPRKIKLKTGEDIKMMECPFCRKVYDTIRRLK